jgi:sigma-B regulation protein RsbU (phosphoserine phosphatase)
MNETILIIDDSTFMLTLLEAILKDKGYCTLVAKDGTTGLDQARKKLPDLILLDIIMPHMDGYEVCQRLQSSKKTRDIPILFLSAKTETENKIKGLQLGGSDYITKPFDKGEVLARVQTHLKIRRLTQDLLQTNAILRENQKRLEEDLNAASCIQRSLLPQTQETRPQLDIAWKFKPSEKIGGDIFNLMPVEEDFLEFYILDVSGHGVPAALVAVSVSQALQPHSNLVTKGGSGLSKTTREINAPNRVLESLDKEFPIERFNKFFTIFYGFLDLKKGILSYSNAGHPPAFLIRSNGSLINLDKGGTIIGLQGMLPFEMDEEKLEPGDKVLLYTDGVIEYENPEQQMYGQKRLLDALNQSRHHQCAQMVENIYEDLLAFGNGMQPKDDISLLVFEFKGA